MRRERPEGYERRRRRAKRSVLGGLPRWVVPVCVCVVVAGVLAGGTLLISRLFPDMTLPFVSNGKVRDYHEYFALEPDEVSLVMDSERLTGSPPPLIDNGAVYLSADFIRRHIDSFLFWDEYSRDVYFTTAADVLRFTPDALEYTRNGEQNALSAPVIIENGGAYLPASLVEALYPYEVEYLSKYNIVLVTDRSLNEDLEYGTANRRTEVRYQPSRESEIAVRAEKDAYFVILGYDSGGYTYVRTADGLLGYVLSSHMEPADAKPESDPLTPPEGAAQPDENVIFDRSEPETFWQAGKKINLVWEAAYNPDATAARMGVPIDGGVNVISPTWFSFDEATFDLISQGTAEYVSWAHGQGCEVWVMLADSSYAGTHALLTDAAARQRLIAQISAGLQALGADGLNVDFERVDDAEGAYFLQFLRELAPAVRKMGAVLSVDVLVPSEWSREYFRGQIAETADFVCVMTYDEHYGGSPASGPVASLSFVQKGVEDMLAEVPKEKLLMGIPFYNRVWREIVDDDRPETRGISHYSMDYTVQFFLDNGAEFSWDPLSGYYYAEFATVEETLRKNAETGEDEPTGENETVRYRVWLEDENSISEKLEIYQSNDLAGVGCWSRGYENEKTRGLLKDTLQ
ncbi:MAG: hypothetical protein LBR83_03040 [Clostridiales bacterium]|jgi:spore germination protein YaaH|nr:hypothetical protein [Clostridiales bacterium]